MSCERGADRYCGQYGHAVGMRIWSDGRYVEGAQGNARVVVLQPRLDRGQAVVDALHASRGKAIGRNLAVDHVDERVDDGVLGRDLGRLVDARDLLDQRFQSFLLREATVCMCVVSQCARRNPVCSRRRRRCSRGVRADGARTRGGGGALSSASRTVARTRMQWDMTHASLRLRTTSERFFGQPPMVLQQNASVPAGRPSRERRAGSRPAEPRSTC